jgi:hypothetical protein
MNHGEQYLALLDELEKMPEHQTGKKIRHFTNSIQIFTRNYEELQKCLQVHNNPEK